MNTTRTISLEEVATELQEMGVKAIYAHTGGNNGTVLIGEGDENGFYDFAVGPSFYDTTLALVEEVSFAKDREHSTQNVKDFCHLDQITPKTVANEIVKMMKENN